jgi:hypothetical protein
VIVISLLMLIDGTGTVSKYRNCGTCTVFKPMDVSN